MARRPVCGHGSDPRRAGQVSWPKLTSVACDVINIIASVVVSGNMRRSALLAVGDPNDSDYLKAKRRDRAASPTGMP